MMATIKREKFLAIQTKKEADNQSDQKSDLKTKRDQKSGLKTESDQKSGLKTEKWPKKWPKKMLKKLQLEGVIRRVGPKKNGHWEVIEQQKSDTENDINDTENV